MTQTWHFTEDGVKPEEFERVQRLLRSAVRPMSARQILALADGLHEIYLARCEQHSSQEAEGPRRRWTDRTLDSSARGQEFSDLFSDAMRAAIADRKTG